MGQLPVAKGSIPGLGLRWHFDIGVDKPSRSWYNAGIVKAGAHWEVWMKVRWLEIRDVEGRVFRFTKAEMEFDATREVLTVAQMEEGKVLQMRWCGVSSIEFGRRC